MSHYVSVLRQKSTEFRKEDFWEQNKGIKAFKRAFWSMSMPLRFSFPSTLFLDLVYILTVMRVGNHPILRAVTSSCSLMPRL